jgi:hypothetical protein
MIELKKQTSSQNNKAKKPLLMQASLSGRKHENMLGLGLLQPSSNYRQNMNDPVFTENNSIIEDLSQQKTNVRDEDYNNFVSWNDLDKMKTLDEGTG